MGTLYRFAGGFLLYVAVALGVVGGLFLWFECLDPSLYYTPIKTCWGILLGFGIPAGLCVAGAVYFHGRAQ